MKASTTGFISFATGAIAVFPVLVIDQYLLSNQGYFSWAFLEEMVKFFPLLFLDRTSLKSFLWNAALIALGFAMAENFLFIKNQPTVDLIVQTAVGRIMGATMMHIVVSLIPAYVWFKRPKLILIAFALAVVFHGFFSFDVGSSTDFSIMGALFVTAEWILVLVWLGFFIRKRIMVFRNRRLALAKTA